MALFLSYVITPFLKLWVYYRALRGREDKTRLHERFGYKTLTLPSPPLWFHAASVGEVLSLKKLITFLQTHKPHQPLLITTTTRTAAHIVKTQFNVCHAFIPFDNPLWIRRFLNNYKPKQAYFVESEVWPFMISEIKKRGIPLMLLSGRISDRSFKRWQCLNPLTRTIARKIFGAFDECYAQNQESYHRLMALGCPTVRGICNLKYTSDPLPVDPTIVALYNDSLMFTWVAASTHPGEEAIIFDIYQKLSTYFPLRLFLAPRHTNRTPDIEKLCQQRNIPYSLMDQATHNNTPKSCVIIINKMGCLGSFYTLADCVFIGGSLIPHGGHNPLEPLLFHTPVVFGPFMANFKDITAFFLEQGAVMAQTPEDVADFLKTLLNNNDLKKRLATKLYDSVLSQQHQCDQLFQHILSTYD